MKTGSPPKGVRKLVNILGYELMGKKEYIQPQEGYHYVPDIYGKSSRKMRDIRQNEPFYSLAKTVRDHKRTYLYYDRLNTLYQALENIARNMPGSDPLYMAEVGVFRGGGSYFLASAAETLMPGRARLYSVDTFEGHSEHDLPGSGLDADHQAKGFDRTDYEQVKTYLSGFPFVTVLKDRVQDCAAQFAEHRFALVHLDVDIYMPTLFSLEFFEERMRPQGIIVVDDYNFLTCPGAKQAVDEYVAKAKRPVTKLELQTGQCLLIYS